VGTHAFLMGVVKIAHPWAIAVPAGFCRRLDLRPMIGPVEAAFTVWLGTCSKINMAMPKNILSSMGRPMMPHCSYARLVEVPLLGQLSSQI
jgi:hypothetical protein